jgi:sugar/nucleoside kinase (ribokinase family)
MSKLAVIGHLAINDTKTKFGRQVYCGGAGFHVAWAAGMVLGKNISLFSRCGNDYDLSTLKNIGVDIRNIETTGEVSDRFIIAENQDRRTFKVEGEVFLKLNLDGCDLSGFDWFHLATAPPKQQLEWLKLIRKGNKKAKISADSFETYLEKNRDDVIDLFKQCDLIFANEYEWLLLDKEKIYPVIVKCGAKGAIYKNEVDDDIVVKTVKINKVVDTTGAGEIVAGVFLALNKIDNEGIQTSLSKACRLASMSIMDFGVEHIAENVDKILLV